MSNLKKLKVAVIETPLGKRRMTFRPVEDKTIIEGTNEQLIGGEYLCDVHCPYGKVCQYLPDPRHPENKEYKFCDLCAELGDRAGDEENEDYSIFRTMVPCDGEIERVFGEDMPKIMDILMEANPMYSLNQIIDAVCPGFCEFYDGEHSQCGAHNSLCILSGLWKGAHIDKSIPQLDILDSTREEIQKESEEAAQKRREERIKELKEEKERLDKESKGL